MTYIEQLKALSDSMSEKESAEAARRERELFLLMNAFSDVVLVVDDKQIIKYANPATFRLLGYDPDELIGNNADIIFNGVNSIVGHSITVPIATKDGCILPVNIYVGEIVDPNFHLFVNVIRKVYDARKQP